MNENPYASPQKVERFPVPVEPGFARSSLGVLALGIASTVGFTIYYDRTGSARCLGTLAFTIPPFLVMGCLCLALRAHPYLTLVHLHCAILGSVLSVLGVCAELSVWDGRCGTMPTPFFQWMGVGGIALITIGIRLSESATEPRE